MSNAVCHTSSTTGEFSFKPKKAPLIPPYSRTGIVFNVAPRAVGVIVYKIIRSRYIEKRVNLRIEHVKHSKCREEFLRRVKSNRQALSEAKQKGERVNLKRSPKQPREGQMLKSKTTPETIAPIAYDTYI